MPKVLVIEDSALMRRQIKQILTDAGFDVSTARDGADALERVASIDPDVITLDINMPRMDGLTFLSHLMSNRPKPVVMISSLTEKGVTATFEALGLGAVDFVLKPDGTVSHNIAAIEKEIIDKVRAASRSRLFRARTLRARMRHERESAGITSPVPAAPLLQLRETPLVECPGVTGASPAVVVIGASTGGPGAIEEILTSLPADLPCVVLVAQHMPAGFTNPFARRLDQACAIQVREVAELMPIQAGVVYIGRGGADFVVTRHGGRLSAAPVPPNPERLWHPSINQLVFAVMRHVPASQLVGVLLTGMGNDGAEAMTAMHRAGGLTIAESEESAVVYGMPHELIKLEGADSVLPSARIADKLLEWALCTTRRRSLA